MAYVYSTGGKTVQVTATSTARALHDDIQTTFAGSTYMQYLIPDSGSIKDALYIFQNGWTFLDATSIGYMTTGGWKDAAGDNIWTNVKCISADDFTGIQLYYNQTGTPTNFGATGLANALLKVRSGGSDIAAQAYTVYQRTFQKVYSQFSTTASAGGVDTIPLNVSADTNLTLSSGTLGAYSDLSLTWGTIHRSAFDGAAATKYTLNGSHTSSVTTITVNEAIDAGVSATGYIQIGNAINGEVISYTGKGTYTFTGCTRHVEGTPTTSYTGGEAVSTNTQQYDINCVTTNAARTLYQIYNWVQYELGLATDIDSGAGTHLGQITDPLVSMAGTTLTTKTGVWIQGFASADANKILYTDHSATLHTPPSTISVAVSFDAAIATAVGQVAVFVLDAPGYTDATYTPAHISSTLINAVATGTSLSTSLVYTADLPVRVVVRAAGYQQFSLYTTVTSAGLSVSSQNPVDPSY